MDNIIENIYLKNNLPGFENLYKLVKAAGHSEIKKNDVKTFLENQKEYELLKIKTKKKKKAGHITASYFKNIAQMDIYDLSKYAGSNKNYKYILALVDVFTRKAYVRPMKKKDVFAVLTNLQDIFLNDAYIPHVITSDMDKTFVSEKIQKLFMDNDIHHDVIIAGNDHNILGIIDRFALTLKNIFSKIFIRNNRLNWIEHLYTVVKQYNNTGHSALDGLTPNEATKPLYHESILLLNNAKINKKSIKSDFLPGDNVRKRINKFFRKGTEPKVSDKIYVVTASNGLRVTLSNGKTYHEADIIKTNFITEKPNIIEKINKTNRTERRLKNVGISKSNVTNEEKRARKPNPKYL